MRRAHTHTHTSAGSDRATQLGRTVVVGIALATALSVPARSSASQSATDPDATREATIDGEQLPDQVMPWGQVVRRRTFPANGEALYDTLSRGVSGGSVRLASGDSVITIALPDGTAVTVPSFAVSESVYPLGDRGLRGATLAWGGRSDGGVVVSMAMFLNPDNPGWQVAGGVVQMPDRVFSIIAASDGTAVIEDAAIDPNEPPEENDAIPTEMAVMLPLDPSIAEDPEGNVSGSALGLTLANPGLGQSAGYPVQPDAPSALPASGTVLRVLGVAMAGVTLAQAQQHLSSGIAETQVALAHSDNSDAHTAAAVQLVGVLTTTYVQSDPSVDGSGTTDVLRLASGYGGFSAVPASRASVGADLVSAVAPARYDGEGACGLSQWPGVFSVTTLNTATGCTGATRHAVAHEIGHGLGATHDDDAPIVGYPNSKAYKYSSSLCSVVATTTGCRQLVYSTPLKDFSGGTGYPRSGTTSRNNALAVSDWLVYATCYAGAGYPSSSAGEYTPLTQPVRVLDSRFGTGGYLRKLDPNQIWSVPVPTSTGVPDNAQSVVVNLTAVDEEGDGYLEAFECGNGFTHQTIQASPHPEGTSVMNYRSGLARAQTVVMPLGEYRFFAVRSLRRTHVVVDVLGFFGAHSEAAGKLHASDTTLPKRVVNTTESPSSPLFQGGTLSGARTYNVDLASPPSGVKAAVVNITALNAVSPGYVTVAADQTSAQSATASNLNYYTGSIEHNLAIVPVVVAGNSTTFGLYSLTSVDILVDVVAWIGSSGTLKYEVCTQSRQQATLQANQAGWLITTGTGAPAAMWASVVSAWPQFPGYVTVAPDGGSIPDTSVVNNVVSTVTNNHDVIYKAGNGKARVFTPGAGTGTLVVIVDREACFQ